VKPAQVAWTAAAIGAMLSQSVWAQSAAPAKLLPGLSGTSVYEDRLIDSGNLPALGDDTVDTSYNADGQPRAWRVEAYGSNINSGGLTRRENGLTFGGRYDTVNYGALSIDGAFRNGLDASVFTAWQRGLTFDNDWRASNGMGMFNTPTIELARNQYRIYLPTFTIAGVQTEWLRSGDLQLQASIGQPGSFSGVRLGSFSRLGGTIFTGGGQWVAAPNWLAGFQFVNLSGVTNSLDPAAPNAKTDGRAVYGTTAWQGSDSRVQFNVINSERGTGGHSQGVWVDGETRDGRYRHNYGIFRMDPGTVWGYLPLVEDSAGGYYRVNYQSQQWLWSGGVDSVSSISGRGTDGIYGSGSIRYQFNRRLGIGAGVTVRHASDAAEAAYAFIEKQSWLGTSRAQLDFAAAVGAQRTQQITLDHAWPAEAGLRLSTSLSFSQETTPAKRISRASVGVNGGIDLLNNLSLDGNLRWLTSNDGGVSRGTSANLSLNWRISSKWSMAMTYYDNRREDQPLLSVATLIPVPILAPVAKDRAIFVTLRYEDRAGSVVAPLGGAPGSGAGNIVGYLFFDTNDNKLRDANESGAPNVTILLDGKFSARTDLQGRFEFPLVASGNHTISVIPDNLPLPYFISTDEKRQVVVRTRETSSLDIAATSRK